MDILHQYKKPVGKRLIQNILDFGTGGRKKARIVLLDESTAMDTILGNLKYPYIWVDELPLKVQGR